MKRVLFILFLCASVCVISAQEDRRQIVRPDTAGVLQTQPVGTVVGGADAAAGIYLHDALPEGMAGAEDSLHLPVFDALGRTYINMYPLDWCGAYSWSLHKGLNVNVGASVFATFGNSAWRGTGFGHNISAMYAIPVTGKLSVAVGGYLNSLYRAHSSWTDAGLNAVIGYKFDEHWEGYLYGQKSLANRRMPFPLYDIGNIGDRIGTAVKYNFSPSFSIQVSVEGRK